MKSSFWLLYTVVLLLTNCFSTPYSSIGGFASLITQYERGYKHLNIPDLQIGYVENIKGIKDKNSLTDQISFFTKFDTLIQKTNYNSLAANEKLDYALMKYDIELNLIRIDLENKWHDHNATHISTKGLSTVTDGNEWYKYFLQKWVDKEVTPDQMYEFGLSEIERVKSRMRQVQVKSGLDSLVFLQYITDESFFYSDIDSIQKAFEDTKTRVAHNLEKTFPFLDMIPEVNIKKGANESMAQVPAYYTDYNNTFYYNYFGKPYSKRQISWIYIHEAIPGHHYQRNLEKILPSSTIQQLNSYFGFAEGYAAYIEEIGYEINAYQDLYDEYGKWEWDIIRSVRVAIDVGLNYYNWSDEEALTFWQLHIDDKDDIALREIARMKRWPAQVITYKYGADRISQWKFKKESEPNFNLKSFHKDLVKHGAMPLSILGKIMNGELATPG